MSADELGLSTTELTVLRTIADELIPAVGPMPSAGSVLTDERLRFVLRARPDLVNPLRDALAESGGAEDARAGQLSEQARTVVDLVIVGGYYSDPEVKRLIGYPGQEARPVNALDYPEYLAEGLLERVLERGSIWRDPANE